MNKEILLISLEFDWKQTAVLGIDWRLEDKDKQGLISFLQGLTDQW